MLPAAVRRAELRSPGERLRCDSGSQRRQCQQVAIQHRQVLDLLLRDGLGHRCALRLQERGLCGDRDGFRHGRHVERERGMRNFTLPEREILEIHRREALQLHLDLVGGRDQVWDGEPAVRVGGGRALGVGPHVDDRHRGARNGCLAGVGHLTADSR